MSIAKEIRDVLRNHIQDDERLSRAVAGLTPLIEVIEEDARSDGREDGYDAGFLNGCEKVANEFGAFKGDVIENLKITFQLINTDRASARVYLARATGLHESEIASWL